MVNYKKKYLVYSLPPKPHTLPTWRLPSIILAGLREPRDVSASL